MKSRVTRTPCIGVCSTTSVGDSICRGCKRYAFEVIRWNAYQDDEKESVLRRIEALTVQIMQDKLHVVSRQALLEAMARFSLPVNMALSPYCWINTLFQKAPLQQLVLEECGLLVAPAYATLSTQALADLVDEQLLTLCQAHFERYFQHVDSFS